MTETANPLIAARADPTQWYSGLGIAESIADTVNGVQSGSWIDSTIGGVSTSLDVLGVVVDPLGSLVSWGLAWLIEHVKPLSDALDWLAGDPDQISAYGQTWRNIAANTADITSSHLDTVTRQVSDWAGKAAQAYRAHAGQQLTAMDAIAKAANGIAIIVEAAGLLVALVREMVRDLIADFVSVLAVRLPMWLAEEGCTFGIATPLVASQVGSLVARWAAKISKLVMALLNSLRKLQPLIRHLGDLIDTLRDVLRRLARTDTTSPMDGSAFHGESGIDPMGRRSDWTDPAAHPQEPAQPPDSHLPGGDPVYHRPGATAIGYDSSTMRNFAAVAPEPGHHDVVVHGERNGLFRPGLVGADGANHPGNYTHPQQIADAIRNNPHYHGGPVRLVSCHSGTVDPDAGIAPPAQQVADALGVPVMAPTNAVGVSSHGPAGQTPRIRDGGQWVTFYPGGGR